MPVTSDIVASYRGPRRVMRRLLAMGTHEGRALAILMAGCAVTFIAQWPRLAREAHLQEADLQMLLGGALLGWVFIAPLAFYLIAFLTHLVSRAMGGQGSAYDARMALFWSFLAATPVLLLHGLVAGFVGPGIELTLVGAAWFAVFLWFWLSNLREAGWGVPA
jgi:nitrogen fixation/metabolism regulation signal transduction histidine kinase